MPVSAPKISIINEISVSEEYQRICVEIEQHFRGYSAEYSTL